MTAATQPVKKIEGTDQFNPEFVMEKFNELIEKVNAHDTTVGMMTEIAEEHIKLLARVGELEARLEKSEKALFKLINQFQSHSHDSIGRALCPVA